jgi:hypothetical protein
VDGLYPHCCSHDGRAVARVWPARHTGISRPGLLFHTEEAHAALEPLLLPGAMTLARQKGLRSLGNSRTIGRTRGVARARVPPVLTTAVRGLTLASTCCGPLVGSGFGWRLFCSR